MVLEVTYGREVVTPRWVAGACLAAWGPEPLEAATKERVRVTSLSLLYNKSFLQDIY